MAANTTALQTAFQNLNNKINSKANSSSIYTKVESDAKFAKKAIVTTTIPTDASQYQEGDTIYVVEP